MARVWRTFVSAIFILSLALSSQTHAWHENKVLSALGSPDAVAAIGFSFNFVNAWATFQWAYNWNRTVTTLEESLVIEEAGGLVSAGLTWFLSCLVPFYFYLYTLYARRHLDPAGAAADIEALRSFDRVSNILSTPLGIAITAFIYTLLSGAATFTWAYNWVRSGVSAQTTARVQEIAGLTSAGLAWFLGAIVPFYAVIYARQATPESDFLPVLGHSNAMLNFLARPIGIAVVNLVYNVLNGAATFMWAYNWTRNGIPQALTSRIQEAGGLVSAGLSWSLSGFSLLYLYLYKRHVGLNRA